MKAGWLKNGYLLFVTDDETDMAVALQWREFASDKIAGAFSSGAEALTALSVAGDELRPFDEVTAVEFIRERLPETLRGPGAPAHNADGNTLVRWLVSMLDPAKPQIVVSKQFLVLVEGF